MIYRSQLCAGCCVWLVLLVALWGNWGFPSLATAQPHYPLVSKDLTIRRVDCTEKCTDKKIWCSSRNNTLCTVGCSCVGNLWNGGRETWCTDDTEARIVCDNVAPDKDDWAGPMDFKIYSAEERNHGGTGYRGVVTAMRTRIQDGKEYTLKWSTCYKRKAVRSDVCSCKCGFALRARPSRMGKCRCIKGI